MNKTIKQFCDENNIELPSCKIVYEDPKTKFKMLPESYALSDIYVEISRKYDQVVEVVEGRKILLYDEKDLKEFFDEK